MLKRLTCILLFVLAAVAANAELLLQYSFEGDVTDATGVYGGNVMGTQGDGTPLAGSPEYIDGKFGQAMYFSGNDWIAVQNGNPLDQLTNEITIAFWTKMDTVQNEVEISAGMDSGGGGRLAFIQFWYGTTYWDTTGNRASAGIPAETADGQWHHWAYTKNATAGIQTIYFDGEIIGQSTDATTSFGDPYGVLALCAHFEWGQTYIGGLDEFMIYSHELTQEEIQKLMVTSTPVLVAPALGQIGVPATDVLQWKAPRDSELAGQADPNAVAFVVYCDPNETFVKNATFDNHAEIDYFSDQPFVGDPSLDPVQVFDPVPDLAINTTYYWRVDTRFDTAAEPNDLVAGAVWSFNTDLKPLISGQPTDVLVFETEEAVFAVTAQDPSGTGLAYQWYQDPDPAASGDEVLLAGRTEATLTVGAPLSQATDEGSYICEVSNSGGSVWSRSARLVIKRLVNHYPLDGNTGDIAGGYDGTVYGDPNFVAGKVGSDSLNLNGADGVGVTLDGAYPNAGQQITVTAWVLADSLSGGASIVKNWTDTTDGFLYFGINGAGTSLEALMGRSTGGAVGVSDSDPFPVGQWQFVAAVFDGGMVRLYRNGLEVGSAPLTGTLDMGTPHVGIGYIPADDGTPSVTSPNYWNGQIDDVRIYNYGLSAEDMAQLYYDVTEIAPCLYPPMYDLDGDCRITLSDIATIAAEWLYCGRYPADGCL